MPTTTYSDDDDITNADPNAYGLLPADDQAEAAGDQFDRLRVAAKAEIDRRISRREPPVYPSSLSDSSELTEAEVRYVLHFLYRDSSVRAGDDLMWVKSEHWRKQAEDEVDSAQLSISGADVSSAQGWSVPIWRS